MKTKDRPKILYVDDQLGNLTVFRASLRRFADIHTARSGAEALERLAEEQFAIVISDQRMEGLSGVELLSEVRRLYPDTVRILLTAYTDFNAVVNAINDGRIARFVRKPWNREEMFAILDDAYQIYQQRVEVRVLNEQMADQRALASYGAESLRLLDTLSDEASRIAAENPERARALLDVVAQLGALAPAA